MADNEKLPLYEQEIIADVMFEFEELLRLHCDCEDDFFSKSDELMFEAMGKIPYDGDEIKLMYHIHARMPKSIRKVREQFINGDYIQVVL